MHGTLSRVYSAYDTGVMMAVGDRCKIQTDDEFMSHLQEKVTETVTDPRFQLGAGFAIVLPLLLLFLSVWVRLFRYAVRSLRSAVTREEVSVVVIQATFPWLSGDTMQAYEELSFVFTNISRAARTMHGACVFDTAALEQAALRLLQSGEPPVGRMAFRCYMAGKRVKHGLGAHGRFDASQFTDLEILVLANMLVTAPSWAVA